MDFKMKYLREEKEITQEEFAKQLGVSKGCISMWETLNDIIPLKRLNTICNYFDVSVDYILGLSNTKKYDNMLKLTKIDYKYVGNNLKRIRKEKGLKQNEVAKMLCTNQPTWSRYESGKTLIVTDKLFDFARKFNVSIDRIIGKII